MTLPVDLTHIPGHASKWPNLLPGTYHVDSNYSGFYNCYSGFYNCIAWAAKRTDRWWWQATEMGEEKTTGCEVRQGA